jgi:hypothetical protein
MRLALLRGINVSERQLRAVVERAPNWRGSAPHHLLMVSNDR